MRIISVFVVKSILHDLLISGVYELLRVCKSIKLEEQSPLNVFKGTVEGSVPSWLKRSRREKSCTKAVHEDSATSSTFGCVDSRYDYEELLYRYFYC